MGGWNHNIHYHDAILSAVPPGCAQALDVGCGRGMLARKLAARCGSVIAIDPDLATLKFAMAEAVPPNVTFLHADAMSAALAEGSFDFVGVVATLHHLPLAPALERFRKLLRPGGVLAVVGLYRPESPIDFANALIAMPVSLAIRLFVGEQPVGAPVTAPAESLSELRQAMQGGRFRRRFFFRYTFVWRKP